MITEEGIEDALERLHLVDGLVSFLNIVLDVLLLSIDFGPIYAKAFLFFCIHVFVGLLAFIGLRFLLVGNLFHLLEFFGIFYRFSQILDWLGDTLVQSPLEDK